jgi:tetratricopeptide (TPR) repeat protein
MSAHLERATLLYQQNRPEQAETELRLALADDPNLAVAHALLALCLSIRQQHLEATREAQASIALAPDMAFCHFALGHVLMNRNRYDEARQAVEQAIAIEPADADYHALLAQLLMHEKDWPGALNAASRGLACDPDSNDCANLRAMALVKLGRKAEANAVIASALARDPENATSHSNLGWTCLERHEHGQALEHFREALRIEPNSESARLGMVEALKSRYWVYGMMLRYFLWMSKLSSRVQWGVILGGFFGMRILNGLQKANPDIKAWTWPISIAYVIFVLLTWLADPLFNLLLRLNKFGRYALTREQVVASNWVGGSLLLAILFIPAGLLFRSQELLLLAAVSGFAVLPLSAVFKCSDGWPQIAMAGYTTLLVGVGIVASLATSMNPGLSQLCMSAFMMGFVASMFVANILVRFEPKL